MNILKQIMNLSPSLVM